MLYSTGSTHLLSAILTRTSGRSTRELAREWLGPVEGFSIGAWDRDPQGIYVGGNQMAMTPRSLLAFGELYRNGGKNNGRRAGGAGRLDREILACRAPIPSIAATAMAMAGSRAQIGGQDVHYAWGYGGQMLYIVPRSRADGGDDLAARTTPRRAAAIATICTRCSPRSSARSGWTSAFRQINDGLHIARKTRSEAYFLARRGHRFVGYRLAASVCHRPVRRSFSCQRPVGGGKKSNGFSIRKRMSEPSLRFVSTP